MHKDYTNEEKFILDLCSSLIKGSSIPYNKNLNWGNIIELLELHQILPLIYPFINKYLSQELKHQTSKLISINKTIIKSNINEIETIAKSAREKGINIIFYKGVVQSQIIYNDNFYRNFGDIDILVEEKDMKAMGSILSNLDYLHIAGADNLVSNNKRKYEILPFQMYKGSWKSHELYEYVKKTNNEKSVFSVVELKRYFHRLVNENGIKYFYKNTQEVVLESIPIPTFNLEFTLIHLFINTYINAESILAGGPKLKDYIDLSMFLTQNTTNLNWIKVNYYIDYLNIGDEVASVIKNLIAIGFIEKYLVDNFKINNFSQSQSIQRQDKQILIWELPFEKRLFQNKVQHWHYMTRKYKEHCYSFDNINYKKAEFVGGNKRIHRRLTNKRDCIDLEYSISYCNEILLVTFEINYLLNLEKNFIITFLIIDKDINSNSMYSHEYSIYRKNEEIFITNKRNGSTNIQDISENNTHHVNIYIPSSLLSLKNNTKLAYEILIEEKVHKNLSMVVGKETLSNDPCVNPPVIQLV
ncbi:nucleotidyltransferase family protein [Metabacillus halosaccharovorans]|uniref:nucleotidyltransferase family protein n=1 Tax=Metabacillus halosaccharovorans TaxID=930124 RepID=UPI00203BF9C2|nr:nucleotidyltransferase family protein [Metabacillus halosaccharovorans]MCM3444731.1 nucleotidyltransferase family protein [Metabacillus halosaccharovorans]